VPPFNPPRRANYGKGLLHDPRLPLGYLRYLFGPQVEDVLRRLEAELHRAQSGETSELLQLLIGRDAETRFRMVDPETMERFPTAPTHQLVQVGVIKR
jgi:hypothetical protein